MREARGRPGLRRVAEKHGRGGGPAQHEQDLRQHRGTGADDDDDVELGLQQRRVDPRAGQGRRHGPGLADDPRIGLRAQRRGPFVQLIAAGVERRPPGRRAVLPGGELTQPRLAEQQPAGDERVVLRGGRAHDSASSTATRSPVSSCRALWYSSSRR
ncbi:hypothetical protein BJF90_07075 [Pseudonocardia sp. CNS-004]|nr:hypothetical protein BJF90_07075 [Pseudonocardia sp. CNS-004]